MFTIDRGLVMELVAKAPSTFNWRAQPAARSGDWRQSHHFCSQRWRDIRPGHGQRAPSGNSGGLLQLSAFQPDVQRAALHRRSTGGAARRAGRYRHLRRLYGAFTLSDKAAMEAAHGRVIPADAIAMASLVFGEDVTQSSAGPVLGGHHQQRAARCAMTTACWVA